MLAGEALLDPLAQRRDRRLGDVGVGEARLGRPHDAFELLHADPEAVLVGPASRRVEDVLLVLDLRQQVRKVGGHLGGRRQRIVEVGRQHRIEQHGAPRELRRKARRAAHDRGDQLEQRRVRLEQREELHAGRQVAEEEIEIEQRLVGRRGVAQRLEQRRHQLGQELAGARRGRCAIAAVMPAPDHARGRRRIAEAQRAQGLERARIVVGAGEDQVAAGAGEARRLLEQPRIVALDAAQRAQHLLLERARIGVAEEGRYSGEARLVLGQAVGLLVGHHLQPVLDPAQEAVVGNQLGSGARLDVARGGERAQALAGAAQPQRRIAAAEDQLLGLGEELDLADATAAELDVVAGHLDRAAAAMGVDLALYRMDVMDRREVEMPPPDVGTQRLDERPADGEIAGHRMRLDHRRALPILADALVVELGRLDRHREWRRAGVGPQPEVGAEDVAVNRCLRHQLHQHARDPDEVARELLVAGQCRRVAIVEQDQVDVARVIELAGAELAHAERGEGRRLRVAAQRKVALALELQQDRRQDRVDAGGGEAAQRGGDALERPGAGDVGARDGERHAALQPAQACRHRLWCRAAQRVGPHRLELGIEPRDQWVGTVAPQIGHEIRVL